MANDPATVVGFIDLGTNSVRLVLAEYRPDGSYAVLSRSKEVVRLGAGEFRDGVLKPDAMHRAAQACGRFAAMARWSGAEEIVAVATSATRDAKNQDEFIELVRETAGFDLRPISGEEEARLIYLGVATDAGIGKRRALFVDIGGGSTELIVGDAKQTHFVASLPLGAIRLHTLVPEASLTTPVSPLQYAAVKESVRAAAGEVIQELKGHATSLAIGSSGTIQNLAEIAVQAIHRRSGASSRLTAIDLKAVVGVLCALSLDERRHVPGINPSRAEIIIAGAAILETLMSDLGVTTITVSQRGLRDGLLVDYLAKRRRGLSVAEAATSSANAKLSKEKGAR